MANKQVNKIAFTLSNNAKAIIEYLEVNNVKTSNAINKAIESYYGEILNKAITYKEKLNKLNNEFKLGDLEDKVEVESGTAKEIYMSKYRIATQNDIEITPDAIIWLKKVEFYKKIDVNFNELISGENKINYFKQKKTKYVQYAFIPKEDDNDNV